jgi:hypothetical protein
VSERRDTTDRAAHAESEARGAELREELATTDLRRAEEAEAKAEAAIEEARKDESKKERKRREAEERRAAAAAEAEDARRKAATTKEQADPEALRSPVSGASVASPGLGSATDPKAAAAAASGTYATPPRAAGSGDVEKPELYVAAAFAGAFVFARILKRIAE